MTWHIFNEMKNSLFVRFKDPAMNQQTLEANKKLFLEDLRICCGIIQTIIPRVL